MLIEISFSAPMTLTKDLFLRASDHARPLEATWSADATLLTLIARPDFAFGRPLADNTEYALDVSALLSEQEAQLEPNVALRDRHLVFTTGRHDALLNHSCGHTFFGPFASVGSSQLPEETAADIGTTHTQYAVSLTETEDGYGGWLRATFATPGQYRLYFDSEVDLLVSGRDADGAVAVALTTTPLACPGITHEATVSTQLGDELFLSLQSAQKPICRVIVELVPDEDSAPP